MLQEHEIKFLKAIKGDYPNAEAVSAEIVSLGTELYLPKGTEHFLSDLHGEYEAFSHIRRSASGVIRRKLERLFEDGMSKEEIDELCSIVYYPDEKLGNLTLDEAKQERIILSLTELLKSVSAKYTRKKVLKRMASAGEFAGVIYEMLYPGNGYGREEMIPNCIKTVIRIGVAKELIKALSTAIKCLAVDRVHIVGDIFDRGARPDKILDELAGENAVDIQWGNHDALWMGASAGSEVCIFGALFNSLTYKNLDFIEVGYGISLRPLADFAREVYLNTDLTAYMPKGDEGGIAILGDDAPLLAAMRKAAAILCFKLEGQLILRNPDFGMAKRLLLDKIDNGEVVIDGVRYPLVDTDFPTLDKENPYSLSKREEDVTAYLKKAFQSSEKLQRHIGFLYKVGSMYTVYNRNLILHGSVPMDEDGEFLPLPAAEGRCGKALMDYCDKMAREAYFVKSRRALDFMWFLWCGRNSPLAGRECIATFERLLINDPATHKEPRNAYYKTWDNPALAEKILVEFGVGGSMSHIINGHIPVEKGQSPIKAGGKLILIDGGFCHAFLGKTGIAGYTLIYNSEGMRISAHAPFSGKEDAIKNNADIMHDTAVFEVRKSRIKRIETDEGKEIIDKITDLMLLREAYKNGDLS